MSVGLIVLASKIGKIQPQHGIVMQIRIYLHHSSIQVAPSMHGQQNKKRETSKGQMIVLVKEEIRYYH